MWRRSTPWPLRESCKRERVSSGGGAAKEREARHGHGGGAGHGRGGGHHGFSAPHRVERDLQKEERES
jgi:hypothetical protein